MQTRNTNGISFSSTKIDRRIGLLLVHGIGDQNRFEHLQKVSDQIIRALRGDKSVHGITVEMLPGASSETSISILILGKERLTLLDIYEVWWRDLGKHPNFRSILSFWAWAVSLAGTRGTFTKPPQGYANPTDGATAKARISFSDRLLLFLKTTYIFVLLAPLSAVLQLASFLPGVGKSPLLRTVFTYLSSVQMYVEPPWKQSGTLVNFDQPRRTSIQRRFLQGLMEMAERDYDRWYIAAHSLGSVIALRGLMYDDSDNARLLTKADFDRPFVSGLLYKRSGSEDTKPAELFRCPAWLSAEDGIDMGRALAGCRGLVTYGSPLETFARTWPSLVPITANSKLPNHFEWINLYDILDLISSPLTSFQQEVQIGKRINKPVDVCCRASRTIFGAHISYLDVWRENRSALMDIRKPTSVIEVLIRWVSDGSKTFGDIAALSGGLELSGAQTFARVISAALQWIGLLFLCCLLWPLAVVLVFRAIGFLIPVIFVLGEDFMQDVNDLIASIIDFPHQAWIWMWNNNLALGILLVLLSFAVGLGAAAFVRYVFETMDVPVRGRPNRPAIYISGAPGDSE